jgi:sugar O-acyltransferase (sialic acid O-acetyltransferase NeuD family)
MAATRTRIIVVGAGGHGCVLVDLIQAQAEAGEPVEVVAILDDAPSTHGASIGGVLVRGGRALLPSIPHDAVIVAVGDNRRRRYLQEDLARMGEVFPPLRHPLAAVSRSAIVEAGAVVCAGAVIGPESRIRIGAIVNTGARLDHHSEVACFAHIGPGATLAGRVSVGAETLIGVGASVLPGVAIGSHATVGAGTVVLADVADGATIVGVPGRVISPSSGP